MSLPEDDRPVVETTETDVEPETDPETEPEAETEPDIAAEVEPDTAPAAEAEDALEPVPLADMYTFRDPAAIGVSFRRSGKVYFFAPGDLKVRQGDQVLAQTEKGIDIGEVVFVKYDKPEGEENRQLKPLVRKALPEDLQAERELQMKEREARKLCEQKVTEHNLPMRVVAADYTFDGSRLTFFFSAEGRVDFRNLVKDLAEMFRTRIELRQIGVRDQAKMIGGLGPCGRPLCCNAWLRNFDPVGIRVAKDQGLSLNPAKISGICDRLMCCLRYEHETYVQLSKKLPKVGQIVATVKGPAVVKSVVLMHERVTVEYSDGKTADLFGDHVWDPDGPPPANLPTEKPAPVDEWEEAPSPLEETAVPDITTADGSGGGASRRRRRRKPGKKGAAEGGAPEPAAEAPKAPRAPSQPRRRPAGDKPAGDRPAGERPATDRAAARPAGERPAADKPAAPPAAGGQAAGEGAAKRRRRPRYRSRPKGDKPAQE